MAALLQLALVMALQAPQAPPPRPPKPLHNPLIIPDKEANLSAFRLDVEVFGWNAAYTEVAAVAMEMARSAEGAHRGETYLLAYPTTSTVPKHNVICHFITHVALPDNPVPLEAAADYLWTIEHSFLTMWPKRPRRHRRPQDMAVTPLWAPMPPAQEQPKGAPTPGTQDATDTVLAQHRRGGSCQPWVGFRLHKNGQTRLHPFRPLDLSARCDLLKLTDSRTVWGKDDLAASMVRFDFNAGPNNEESARFVVSSLWDQGRQLHFVVAPGAPLGPKAQAAFRATLGPWGRVSFKKPPQGPPSRRRLQALTVTAAPGWLPLARSLAADLGYPDAQWRAQDDLDATIVMALGPKAPAEPAAQGPAPTAPEADGNPAGSGPAAAPAVPLPAPKRAPKPASPYLQDFKVP